MVDDAQRQRGAVWFFHSNVRSDQFLLLEPKATEGDERPRGNGAARKSSPDDYLRSSLDQVRVMDFNTDDPSEPMKLTDAWGNVIDER